MAGRIRVAPRTARPTTTTEAKTKSQPKDKPASKPKKSETSNREKRTCIICGSSHVYRLELAFYNTPYAPASENNNAYSRICKNCVEKMYQDILTKTDNVYLAVETCCHYLDVPYVPAFAKITELNKNRRPMSEYVNTLLTSQAYEGLTYADSIADRYTPDGEQKIATPREKDWDKDSVQNMNYIKNIVGYDPFDDETYSDADRKFLYNTMSGYCPDSTIANDSHKLNSIINIVRQLLQVNKVTNEINRQLSLPVEEQTDIKNLADMQKTFFQSIDRMAEKNSISQAKSSRGANTLTARMQMLQNDGFRNIEVNMFDIKQAKQLQALADMSAKAMINAIELEDNDYSEIIAEQRDMVVRLNRENEELKEQVRILTNEKEAGIYKDVRNSE